MDIKQLRTIAEELTPVDIEQLFEDMIRELYPKTTEVGFLTLNTVETMKEGDPTAWRCAYADFEASEEEEGRIVVPTRPIVSHRKLI